MGQQRGGEAGGEAEFAERGIGRFQRRISNCPAFYPKLAPWGLKLWGQLAQVKRAGL